MITTDVVNDRVEMRAYGQLSLADLKWFEEQSDYCMRFSGPIDLFLDLRSMTHASLDALLEEWRYAHRHARDFRRIAVVSDDQWVSLGSWLSQLFIAAEVRVFPSERPARRWLEDDTLATPAFEDETASTTEH